MLVLMFLRNGDAMPTDLRGPEILLELDTRIPRWNQADLEERPCPLCGTFVEAALFRRPDGLQIRRCGICQTFFVSPAPTHDALSLFYRNYHRTHFNDPIASVAELRMDLDQTDPYLDPRIQTLSSHVELRSTIVLDVGCGKGKFLYQLQKLGAQAHGLELDETAIHFARGLGLENVRLGTVESMPGKSNFTLISALDVIEHPVRPMDMLESMVRLLEPGGLILIWTPNGNCPTSDPVKTTFRVDLEHMQYLSPQSVAFVANRLDLEILHLETLGYPALDNITAAGPRHVDTRDHTLKRAVKRLPGFSKLNALKRRLQTSPSQRRGNYHLFSILKKRPGS